MKRTNAKTKPDKAKSQGLVRELAGLYEIDETGWLEQMVNLIHKRKYDRLDYKNLAEYLQDMAKRDRREVVSRLATMLAHMLKRDHQPSMNSRSWENTIRVQRHELVDLCESRTLRNFAREILPRAYARARDEAAAETGLPESRFPPECPYGLDDLLEESRQTHE
jgi:hypothetical protein